MSTKTSDSEATPAPPGPAGRPPRNMATRSATAVPTRSASTTTTPTFPSSSSSAWNAPRRLVPQTFQRCRRPFIGVQVEGEPDLVTEDSRPLEPLAGSEQREQRPLQNL